MAFCANKFGGTWSGDNHFAAIHLLSKIALCDEQNLPKSVHRDEQMPGIIAIA